MSQIRKMEGRPRTLNQQLLHNKDSVIESAANRVFGEGNWEPHKIVGNYNADNRHEIFRIGEVDFVEFWPIEFKNKEYDRCCKILVTQKWKVLNEPEKEK
jgi:hypothetical protein